MADTLWADAAMPDKCPYISCYYHPPITLPGSSPSIQFSPAQGWQPGELTSLKYAVQVWQVSNLHHVALEKPFWCYKVFAHHWKQDMLYLPAV